MVTADEKSGETVRLIKFDGSETAWHEWSIKTLQLAKSKGFRHVYAKDTKPIDDDAYLVSTDDDEKKKYELNDKAYQLLILSVSGIAFGIVNSAKTDDLMDGDAFLAWQYLEDRYAPHQVTDLIQLTGEFNDCTLESTKADPDEWFIALDNIKNRMRQIDTSFEKKEVEVIAHMMNKLPKEYSEVITVIEGMGTITLSDLKSKLRAFYKRKFKDLNTNEIALFANGKFKGLCKNCGKQGHKAADCRSKSNTAGANKETKGKGVKCFNCNKYAGHIAKDCPEEKKTKEKKETGMFVGIVETIEIHDEKSDTDDDFEIINLTTNNKTFFDYEYVEDTKVYITCEETEYAFIGVTIEIEDEEINQAHHASIKNSESKICASIEENERWLADTGATSHITMCNKYMTNVKAVNVRVVVGDGKEVICKERGDVCVRNKVTNETLLLKNVLYTPTFHKNIISIGTFVRDGKYELGMKHNKMTLTKAGKTETLDFKRDHSDVLYYFQGTRGIYPGGSDILSAEVITTKLTSMDINEAHAKYGHIGEAALRATMKSLGIKMTGVMYTCEGCALAKAKAKSVPKITMSKATQPGERLCTDISGPYKKSILGNDYWILVVDDYTGKSWSFFVKKKSQLASKIEDLLTKLKTAEYVTKFLRCDNAGENVSGLTKLCEKFNIQIEFTAPYTPQQNGIVERKFVTIRQRACAAMFAAKFNDEFQGLLWAEAINTNTRITNIVATSNDVKSADEKFYKKVPMIYDHLMHFGRIGWVKIGAKKTNKLEEKAIKCVMVGYSHDHAGDTYRMFNPQTRKILNSRNIRWADWHGQTSPIAGLRDFNVEGDTEVVVIPIDDEKQDEDVLPVVPPIQQDIDLETPVPVVKQTRFQLSEAVGKLGDEINKDASKKAKLERELKRLDGWKEVTGKRSARRSLQLDDKDKGSIEEIDYSEAAYQDDDELFQSEEGVERFYAYSTTLASDPGEPKHYKEAMKGDESKQWTVAIKNEINNFYKRNVWKMVPRDNLKGRKPLGTRWVFKKKSEQDKSIRYKGRIVVKGYVQIPGLDFTDSFAPVATDASMRMIFALSLYKWDKSEEIRWVCEIIDVEAAFLEGDMEEQIYIEWPDGVLDFGFETQETMKNKCIKLEKAMYGTVQAALQFFKKMVQNLTKVGLRQSKVDPCVFFIKENNALILIIATHVDDCAIAGKPNDIKWFKNEIKKHFTIKELGPLKKHLGVWYDWGQDKVGRYLESSMEDFVHVMLQDYHDIFGKYPRDASTPAFPGIVLRMNPDKVILHKEYRSMVGKLLYFVKKVGPICANACRELSQHLENPGDAHWSAVERLLGFIATDERNRKLKMRPPHELRVQDVVDSSFGDNPDTRKSTSAYLGTIGGASLVNWISKGQKIVTVSSTEAEYVALSDGSKETTFIMNLLNEVEYVEMPSIIAEDNTGAIFLSKNQQVGSRTKHIDVRYHFIREKVKAGDIRVDYVNTLKNPADLLSKNVTQKIHDTHATHIMNGTMDCWFRDQGG